MIKIRTLGSIILILSVFLFLNACAGSSAYMVRSERAFDSVKGKALVYIMRPSGLGSAINFQIWDGDKFLGLSQAKSYFQYTAEPGRHIFMAIAENKVFIEANLAPDKTYYIVTRPKMGAWKARVAFDPVKKDSKYWSQKQKWIDGSINIVPVEEERKKWEDAKKEEARRLINYFKTEYKKTGKYQVIKPEDGV